MIFARRGRWAPGDYMKAKSEHNNGYTETYSWDIRRSADIAAQCDLLMMAGLTERSLERAMKGLFHRDDNLCDVAIADDEEIDQLEKQVDKDGFAILFRFQPVASDLRRVISAMKLSPNIERVGDQATNIARRARKLNQHPPLPEVQMIEPMQRKAMAMFKDSVDAYVRENVELGSLGLQSATSIGRNESRCKWRN